VAFHRIRARPPRDAVRRPATLEGTDAVAVYVQDAARTPGGHTPLVALPRTEGEVAWVLREAPAVLPVGALSSLTGGATPFGEWVLSTARLDTIGPVRGHRVRLGPGVALSSLDEALRPQGLFYPPAPTYKGAFIGGTAATNAAGAVTFKYGTSRAWIEGLTVVLAGGDVLDLERGVVTAGPDGRFDVVTCAGELRAFEIPSYRLPDVPKRSAGYHAAPGMDLVDLFVGSEGTLGVITEVEVRVAPLRPRLGGWLPLPTEAKALELVERLCAASRATWAGGDPQGIDIASIESVDRRSLDLLAEDDSLREQGVALTPGTGAALLFEAELPAGTDAARAMDALALEPGAADSPLARLARLLEGAGAVEGLIVALPGDTRRQQQLESLRESVPLGVNHRVEAAQRAVDPRIHKVATDMIVPRERLGESLHVYREAFGRRGLDHLVFGHASDGNLHANVLPRSYADVEAGEAAILEIGAEILRMGGCPLAEHGVGRSPVKQALLRAVVGEDGIEQMRRVKRALDPDGRLAPGVLFPGT
jgi:D-lactate dehydrogenase (cytochrome)